MKKTILRATLVVAFALIAGYSVYTSQQETEMSALTLANVEALASGESTSNTGPGKRMIVLVGVLAMGKCV